MNEPSTSKITTTDLLVAIVALVEQFGENDTVTITTIKRVIDRMQGGEFPELALSGMGDGKTVNITVLYSKEQQDEWRRMGLFHKNPTGEMN
jgi:hypothetical protein